MTLKLDDLKALLDRDEPNYDEILSKDPSILELYSIQLLSSGNDRIRVGAAYVLGAISNDETIYGVANFTKYSKSTRLAIAGGLIKNKSPYMPAIARLLKDNNLGVVRFAIKAASKHLHRDTSGEILTLLDTLSRDGDIPDLVRSEIFGVLKSVEGR